jgi:TetR/AcrR family transcriptional regulator
MKKHTPLTEYSDAAEMGIPRKRAPRGDRVRKTVLDVALECFSTHGFGGTSTRMIAELSGVTHSLILYHFETKDKLWIATMEEVVGNYAKGIKDILTRNRQRPASETLGKFIKEFIRMSARMPQVHRILTQQSTQSSQRLDWLIETHLRDHFVTVRDLIHQGQIEGVVREGDPARLYYFIIGAVGTPFAVGREYRILTGRDIFSVAEIHHLTEFISDVVFVRGKTETRPPLKGARLKTAKTKPAS